GQNGWGSPSAVLPMGGGALLLVIFALWEGRLARRPGGQPLIDLSLFGSRSFTWGTLLGALAAFGMSGVLFTLPQFSQAVLGADAMGAGVQLLPVVAGLLVGAVSANRLSSRVGARVTAAVGFALMAAGLGMGAFTHAETGYAFVAAWVAICGAGLGFAFSSAAAGAVSALPADRSGVGSAVMQAIQKVGVPLGAAMLGSVFSTVYQGRLVVTGLPERVAAAVQRSAFAGVTVAEQTHSSALLASVRTAFAAGMDRMLLVCAAVTGVSVALALVFLPARQSSTKGAPDATLREAGRTV
ncbi:MAG TPA: MFS transporter, partial [bacterium]|nr:MFS transporter [bacterium]